MCSLYWRSGEEPTLQSGLDGIINHYHYVFFKIQFLLKITFDKNNLILLVAMIIFYEFPESRASP